MAKKRGRRKSEVRKVAQGIYLTEPVRKALLAESARTGRPISDVVERVVMERFGVVDASQLAVRTPDDPHAPVDLVIGELHEEDGTMSNRPSLYRLPEDELFQGMFITGAAGAGKSAGTLYPFLRQLVEHPARLGGLVLDLKGDLAELAARYAGLCDRAGDVVRIRPGATAFNIIPAWMSPAQVASMLVTRLASGHPAEAFWSQAGEDAIRNAVALRRLESEYVVAQDVVELLANRELLQMAMNRLEIIGESGKVPETEIAPIRSWWERWTKGSDELAARVASSVTGALGFAVGPQYNPKRSDPQFDVVDCLNRGKICVLDMSVTDYGNAAPAMAMLLKSAFMCAVLRRMSEANRKGMEGRAAAVAAAGRERGRFEGVKAAADNATLSDEVRRTAEAEYGALFAKYRTEVEREMEGGSDGSLVNMSRPVFLLAEEYQAYASASGMLGRSDGAFFGMARRARCACIVSTHSVSALRQHMPAEAVDELLANLHNHVWLATTDPATAEDASRRCGGRFPASEFTSLPQFAAVYRGSGVNAQARPTRLYLARYWELDAALGRGGNGRLPSWFEYVARLRAEKEEPANARQPAAESAGRARKPAVAAKRKIRR